MEIDDIKQINIVISRYNEDLSWVYPFVSDFKITVYNKGSELTNPKLNKIIKLPNIH